MNHAAASAPMLFLIPGLPLLSFLILILFGRWLGKLSAWLSVAALASAFCLTMSLAGRVTHGDPVGIRWAWLSAVNPRWTIGFFVDGLSWLMLFIITSIGTMIQLYSIGYMHDDPRFSRFFAYLSLFCASMLGLVMADHFVLLYACWELVGLCSFLLIGFWFEKPSAVAASRKAFLTTRFGDCGLLGGIMLLAWATGQLGFANLPAIRADLVAQHKEGLLTLISTLIFFGSVGKSAQFPLHVWLPDAMEGPTPVSALIHAATMVAAGVYLVARTFVLFTPQSLAIVLAIGLITHIFAGTVALTMTDIKKVLAYSTISQLGLMMTALGLGSPAIAMFHLTTHAFFKALLFLGAGSVIHATHQQELSHLGGLIDSMLITGITFLIASMSMSGVFPLSGFWSKDAILLEAQYRAPVVFACLLFGAVMTSSYIFRLYLRCFHGRASHDAAHAHESPPIMAGPLVVLAVGAVLVGLLGSPFVHHWFFHLVGSEETHEGLDLGMLAISTGVASLGVWLAWDIGMRRRNYVPAPLRPAATAIYRVVANKYYIDELYQAVLIRPFLATTRWLSKFDSVVVDGMVNGAGAGGWQLSQWKAAFDRAVVDRVVNGLAECVRAVGSAGRRLQTGLVHHYLLAVTVAVVAIAVWLR